MLSTLLVVLTWIAASGFIGVSIFFILAAIFAVRETGTKAPLWILLIVVPFGIVAPVIAAIALMNVISTYVTV